MENRNLDKFLTSFTGADVRMFLGGQEIGEAQGISISSAREVAPIYTLGSPEPRSWSRGKRGIGGVLIFVTLQADALMTWATDTSQTVWLWSYESETRGEELVLSSSRPAAGAANLKVSKAPVYPDQIPPFNATLLAQNEMGIKSRMEVFGIQILNTNMGISIDETAHEVTHQYVAMSYRPMRKDTGSFSEVALVGVQ